MCIRDRDNPAVASATEKVYQELEDADIEVLFDDRDESPGVKFNDVDLLGIPLRLTLSPRTLQSQNIEAKWRTKKETQLLPLENLSREIKKLLSET